jgi:hypothetical protein
LPAAATLRSAIGMGRHFICLRCTRLLSVSNAWKTACAGVAWLALMLCFAISMQQRSWMPYLGFPVALAITLLIAMRFARLRVVRRTSSWISTVNFGVLGLFICGLLYAFPP